MTDWLEGEELESNKYSRLVEHNSAVREDYTSIYHIKDALTKYANIENKEHLAEALQEWAEFTNDEQAVLNLAPSKGGIFTTLERRLLKENAVKYARGDI